MTTISDDNDAGIPRVIGEADIARALTMPDLIEVMERALIDHARGKVDQPLRQIHYSDTHNGHVGLMLLIGSSTGLKLVTFFPGNADRGLPTHQATILLLDADTGRLRAVLDGRLITEMRTAAVSAVATRLLSDPSARTLAILGTGVQARAHIEALSLVQQFDDIRVWGRAPDKVRHLCAATHTTPATSPESAVQDADVIVTATSAITPILHGRWLKPGCHVNIVGWNGAGSREADDEVMRHTVIVDSCQEVEAHCGNIRSSGTPVTAELGRLLLDAQDGLREDTTVFRSVGMAVEDIYAAASVLKPVS